MAQAALTLPDGAQTPVVVQINPNDFPLMLVGVTSQGLPLLSCRKSWKSSGRSWSRSPVWPR